MKNNKIKTMILAGVACLSLTACGDFLEIEPKNFVSEDNFWNEKTDIDQMVTGTYVKMQSDPFIRRCIMWGETRSDNVIAGLDCEKPAQRDIYRTLQEQLLPTNPYANWESFYAVINQCNIIIQRAPEVSEKDPGYTPTDVLATQAEMAFLRDLCYFYLVRAFKDVPYYTHAIQEDESAVPIAATSGDDIVKALIADLESVVGNALKAYPEDGSSQFKSNCNRATQNSIYALLADLCLWDGQYQKCVDYAQRVIDAKLQEYHKDYANQTGGSTYSIINGRLVEKENVDIFKWNSDEGEGYPLIPCFKKNSTEFGSDFAAIFGNGNSFESIFELNFSKASDEDKYISNSACGTLYGNYYNKEGNSGRGFLTVSEELCNDLPYNLTKIFRNRYDGRFYTSLAANGDYTTSYPAKFVNLEMTISQASSDSQLPFKVSKTTPGSANFVNKNWIFYRLTDVMLMQAEALIRKAASDEYLLHDDAGVVLKDEDGIQLHDKDLHRAFGLIYAVNRRSLLASTTGTNATVNTNELKPIPATRKDMLTLCKQERRRELLFEGKRWFDLVRYYRLDGESVPKKKMATKIVDAEKLFWPYYHYELKNNPLLTQKPAYDNSAGESED